jgi:outer membrane protein TolC
MQRTTFFGSIQKSFLTIFLIAICLCSYSQNTNDTTAALTLKQCIDYAIKHQPALQRSLINVSVTKATNAIDLSGWYPQVSATGSITHYIQQPTTFFNQGGTTTPQKSGIINTAIPGIGVTQSIFSPSLHYASKTAPLYVQEAEQVTDSVKIELVSAVSKSFYSLLLTLEQINVLKEDTIRLAQNVRDSYHQFIGGIVDETDYEQATITLNNSTAQLKQATENLVPQYAILKQLMGYAPQNQFNISFDTVQMAKEINIDTTSQLQYEKRIELKQLTVEKNLQHQLTEYYQHADLPTLSAFYNYNHEFENNQLSKLFGYAYPNSLIGLTVSVPVFTGFARVQGLRRSKLQEKMLDWSGVDIKSQIYSQYTSALANYKSNLYNLHVLENNVTLAKRVYFVVTLQYKQGIVAYLNVITAESNLITSEIGYLNALFQVLSSKIDLQKAMGDISY